MLLNNKIYLFLIPLLTINISIAKTTWPIYVKKCPQDTPSYNKIVYGRLNNHSPPTILYRVGTGKNNVLQGVALDSKKRTLYSLHVTGKPEMGVLNRFTNIDGEMQLVASDYQKPSAKIGHQGITLIPGTDWLLSSSGNAIKNKGWYISLFKYSPNDTPRALSTIRIFDASYSKTTSSMPVISPNVDRLLVRGRKNNHNVIRIYDLKKIDLFKVNDISHIQKIEWEVDNSLIDNKYYFQAMTADNEFIYLLSGRSGNEHKRLYIYTFNGEVVTKIRNITLGKNDAIASGTEAHWEPEGLTVDSKTCELYLLFAVGDKGKRLGYMYKLKTHEK